MANTITKISTLLMAALLMLSFFPVAAAAESAAGAQALIIDTRNRYEDMDKTWDQGYVPKVSTSAAQVVLPLVLNPQSGVTAIAQDTLTVRPDYGDPAGSPFVFQNTEKRVRLADHAINGAGGTKQAWLLSFRLPLEKHRVNGRYPVTLHVSYTLPDGVAATQDFTVYVTIRNGIDPNATPKPAPTPKPTAPPPPQPRLIVSRCAVTPEIVQAGQEFQLDFDIRNTSQSVDVRNIKITLKGEGDDLTPVSASNTLVVASLDKTETEPCSFKMKVRLDAEPKPQKVTIAIDYEDGNGTAYSAADEVLVQVTQPMRVEFDTPSIPANATAGDTVPVSLNVFNMGRSSVQNVLCKVSAPGLLPEGSAFLGNMEPGAGKRAEFFVYVGTRDMSLSEDGKIVTDSNAQELYGATEGFIDVSWEDEFGNKYNEQVKLGTQIQEPVAPATAPPAAEENPQAGQWWVSVAVGAAAIAAILAVMAALRRKRRREVAGGDEAD